MPVTGIFTVCVYWCNAVILGSGLQLQLIHWLFTLFQMCLDCCFGFGRNGPRGGSFAARYQSSNYGGETPGGGWFACCQSRGMKDEGALCGSILPFILGALLISIGVISCFYPHHLFLLQNSLYYNIFFIQFGLFSLDKIIIAVGFFICFNSLFCCDSCSKTFLNIIISSLLIEVVSTGYVTKTVKTV